MRLQILAPLLLSAALVSATGCRQTTTGTIAGGPAPPGALSPISPNQQPILGPFTGNTRVTPPATGSYQPTGGYLGTSSGPAVQPGLGMNQSSLPAANQPIGSGVQVAGWTETNALVPTGGLNVAGQTIAGPVASSPSDPRSGGMQVNDLTGAPAPPGYRPMIASPTQSISVVGGTSQPYQGTPYPSAPYQNAPIQNSPYQGVAAAVHTAPSGVVNPQPWQSQSVALPNNQVAILPQTTPGAMADSNQGNQFQSSALQPLPQSPTTEPVNTANGTADLMWRRPTPQF